MNTEVDGCQFLYIKTFKTQLCSHRIYLYCSGNVFFLIFRDYNSVEVHMLKGDGGGRLLLPWKVHRLFFGSWRFYGLWMSVLELHLSLRYWKV